MEHIWVYLSQFQNKGKIEKVGKKGKFNLYKTVEMKIEELDIQILKKMIPEFIKNGIEVDLSKNEIERVKELYA